MIITIHKNANGTNIAHNAVYNQLESYTIDTGIGKYIIQRVSLRNIILRINYRCPGQYLTYNHGLAITCRPGLLVIDIETIAGITCQRLGKAGITFR